MGLDNGIIIECASKEQAEHIIDEAATHLTNLELCYENNKVEVCYWRKCWNIRREIIKILRMAKNEYEHVIDLEDIKPIIKSLCKFLNETTWEEDDDGSIWTYDEIKDDLFWNVMNLTWLYHYKMENPEIEIYFYDSY